MLKLGYKASAEQFGPTELLDFSCLAEEVGFDSVFVSDHFQPWKHTDGHAPNALAWLGALGARTSRAVIGTSVADADLPLSPLDRGAGLRHARRDVPGPRRARRRHRRVAERGAVDRHRMARRQGAVRPAARGDRADPQAVDRGPRQLRGPVLPDREAPRSTTSRRQKVPIWVAASGPLAAQMAGQVAEGFICTSGKAPQLYTETLLPKVEEGAGKRRPRRRRRSSG